MLKAGNTILSFNTTCIYIVQLVLLSLYIVQLCTLTHSPAGLWPHCMNPTPRAPSGHKDRLLPHTSLGTGHRPHLEWLGAALGSSPLDPEDCRRAWGRAVSAHTGSKGRWSIRCIYVRMCTVGEEISRHTRTHTHLHLLHRHICVCIHACTHIYICTYIRTYICMHTHI